MRWGYVCLFISLLVCLFIQEERDIKNESEEKSSEHGIGS